MKFYTNNSFIQTHAGIHSATNFICPEKLYLDMTEDCNMYCQMCRDVRSLSGKTMDFGLFKRIVDETAPYVKSYSLFNWGEPLLVKDFKDRVRYLNEKKSPEASVDISTNGMLLNDDWIDFLHQEGVIVTVSFDGADQATFEHIRRGANFEQICRNIKKLANVYSDAPLPVSPGIYTSIQKDNAHQLTAIARLAYQLGVRRMGFGLVTKPVEYAACLDTALRTEIKTAAAFLDLHGMLNDLYPTRVGDYVWSGDRYVLMDEFILTSTCTAPRMDASIGYNGDVFLCCNVGAYVDNIADQSFLDLWKSERYEQLRQTVNSKQTGSEYCQHCAWCNRV